MSRSPIFLVLHLWRFVRSQVIQIPAYLLVFAYDVVEAVIPVLTPYYPVGFAIFLYLLAIIGAGIAHWTQSGGEEESVWSRVAGGVCLVVGSLSLLFGAAIGGPLVASADNPAPLAITGTTGVVFFVGGCSVVRRHEGSHQRATSDVLCLRNYPISQQRIGDLHGSNVPVSCAADSDSRILLNRVDIQVYH